MSKAKVAKTNTWEAGRPRPSPLRRARECGVLFLKHTTGHTYTHVYLGALAARAAHTPYPATRAAAVTSASPHWSQLALQVNGL